MTLAGEALSKLYRYEVWLSEPVNEARFANLLYCGIDDTGLLAVARGLFGNSGLWLVWVWCLDEVVGCSGLPRLVCCLAPGWSDCLYLLDIYLMKPGSKILTVIYPLLANAIVLLEIGVKTGCGCMRSCRVGELVIRLSHHGCSFACANGCRLFG